MTNNPFEIPEQFRQMAEKSVEQARAAYDQLLDGMMKAQSMWTSGMAGNPMAASLQTVQERAVEYANQNAKAALDLAAEIARAKDITEILSAQTRYAQGQMRAYAEQTQSLTKLIASMAPTTAKR
jgi:hypothetical protein